MNGSWTDVKNSDRFAIVIHNFHQEEPHRLQLSVAESVLISQENGQWYFGNSTKNKHRQGIFPKSYVRIMDSIVDKSGPTEEIVLNQPKIVQEITSVLREWGEMLKVLFVNHSSNFRVIKAIMYDLMAYRSRIISGKFPADELKQIKRIVTSKIDVGNNLLGLDMVVRDDQGNILNPELTSTVELYRHHHLAKERILKATSEPISKEEKRLTSQQYCHALFVCVRDFVCKLIEDFELLMCLYDVKEGKPFTENYVIKWSKGASMETDFPRVFFTDLGTRDILRDRVYLVSYIVRLGGMEKSLTPSKSQPPQSDPMRRPFGVAAKDITLYVNGKLEPGEEDTVILPLLMCEKDNLEGTLKRILTIKDLTHKDHKGYHLNVRLKMLHGDLKQVREENPHLVLGQVSVARKMGFPEVILPDDVRNDLYLTLVSGEFSKGSKSTDKNVQVTVQVCSETGQILQGVIQSGSDISEYRSVVYYHEDKPRWAETCRISVPIDEFKVSHLRFLFKHRSSNDTKDRNEKPFAMSFVSLMQKNGTTLPDTTHELLVYKVDHKKYDPQDMSYLTLPSRRIDLEEGTKRSCNGLTSSNKDSFVIQTNVCSTKLTQNIDLLGLLNWNPEVSSPEVLNSLDALIKNVSGEEIVKFLQDVLDALFNILMENTDSNVYDKVFNALLHIIGLVSDRKYDHFEPVLDLYIKEGFCATLAHHKLTAVLKNHFDNINPSESEREILLKTMKSLQYIMRFIVRSRILFTELNGAKEEDEFIEALTDVLSSLGLLMRSNSDTLLLVQGACLKYLPSTIPDILKVFKPVLLSQLLAELIENVPPQRLIKQKMMSLSDVVHSALFLTSESRKVLLRVILLQIKDLLETKDEEFRIKTKSVAKVAKVLGESEAKLQDIQDTPHEPPVELCVNILSDIMELLFRDDIGPTMYDLQLIMHSILRTVIQTSITMGREEHLAGNLVSIMLAILRQMKPNHFEDYIKRFPTRTDLLDFLMEILLVFKDLVSRSVFPRDWCEMIMVQNSIILKSLHFFSHTIRDDFSTKFEHQAWNNFFHCAISFLTQPALQLETFSEGKRRRIIARYKDMRMETGFQIKSMWFNLGQNKKQFIPSLVGPFLEMTLIPEPDLRKETLPIFFDMMQCEFYSPRETSDRRDSTHIKANFLEFENEMISKLDNLVEGGRGDEEYKDLFLSIISPLCENHAVLKDQGLKFVKTVTRLMERLLEYRCIINDENKENTMSCTVNLLDFYSEINRKQMYIRYLNKLCDLHLESDNYTEAAYTLKLHSKLLRWSDDNLSALLRSSKYPHCHTHRQLKESLYHTIIDYFDSGKMWENAVEVCKELSKQYEEQVHDLHQLSALLRRMADFYEAIMNKLRPGPEYFRVAYYGRGFPPFLQNKIFIYRGKEYERLSDFCTRTLNQFPKAELMNTLTAPGEDITESPNQYVQINKVEPIMDEKKQRSFVNSVSAQVLKFHRVNNVQKFRFSRPYHIKDSLFGDDNEFATLWIERNILVTSYPLPGILRWFPVTSTDTYHLSPLANAIETMQQSNEVLKELIIEHKKDPNLPINPLSLRLNGILDAAVMGGINNYEKAFFTPEYLESNPDKAALVTQLKELIASQIPLLEIGLKIHGDVAPPSLIPFQQRLEQCFSQMQLHVVTNYGAKSCDIKYEPVTLRRQTSNTRNSGETNRLSGTSFGSTEGNRSRVSSLTKSQVASLKTFVNFASLSPSSTLTRAGSAYVRSTSSALSTPSISRKEKKKKRRHTNKERECPESPRPSSQWYTSPATTPTSSIILDESPTIVELRQQLTPSRPLRSEVEKERRLSRPPSGQFQNRLSLPSTNGNRDSLGTTDSTASEEDPPPLPVKTREADYCNLPDETDSCLTISQAPSTPRVRSKPVPPVPVEINHQGRPPTPPPKRLPTKGFSTP